MQNTNKRSRNVWTCRNDIWKQICDTKCCNVVQIVGVVFEHYYHFKRNGLVICFHFMQHCVYLFVCVCVGVCLQNRSLLYYFWSISQQESSLPWPDIYYTLSAHICICRHTRSRRRVCVCLWLRFGGAWQSDGWKAGDGDQSLSREIWWMKVDKDNKHSVLGCIVWD